MDFTCWGGGGFTVFEIVKISHRPTENLAASNGRTICLRNAFSRKFPGCNYDSVGQMAAYDRCVRGGRVLVLCCYPIIENFSVVGVFRLYFSSSCWLSVEKRIIFIIHWADSRKLLNDSKAHGVPLNACSYSVGHQILCSQKSPPISAFLSRWE